MAPTSQTTPYRAILALHRYVDEALRPLLSDLDLDFATESVVAVSRAELQALSQGADPLTALVKISGQIDDGTTSWPRSVDAPSLLICEPSLANAILGRIWQSRRDPSADLTEVEMAMLQRFVRDVCTRWNEAWEGESLALTPHFQLAGPLSMIEQQAPEQTWHVARLVVLDDERQVGVLLFCYPDRLVQPLAAARAQISWRTRVRRGLTPDEREKVTQQLDKLGGLTMPAPVTFRTELPLQAVGQLERGDVIALDAPAGSELQLRVLDREIFARLARSGAKLAIAVGGAPAVGAQPPRPEDFESYDLPTATDPDQNWEQPA